MYLMLGTLCMDYKYEEAEVLAQKLKKETELPVQAYANLVDFYTKTRRYDEADSLIRSAEEQYGEELIFQYLNRYIEDNNRYRERHNSGKQEFMPNPQEKRTEVQEKYKTFLKTIGIDLQQAADKVLTPSNKDDVDPEDKNVIIDELLSDLDQW